MNKWKTIVHFRVLLIGEWYGHKFSNGQIFYETHITRIRKSYVNDCLDKRKAFLLRVLSIIVKLSLTQ